MKRDGNEGERERGREGERERERIYIKGNLDGLPRGWRAWRKRETLIKVQKTCGESDQKLNN